jgi:hypothetical protein
MDRDDAIKRFMADNPTGLAWNDKPLKELIAGRPFAFVGTHEGLHVVIEGERLVYQVRVCPADEAQRLADKANRELGLSEDDIDRLVEQSLPNK